MARIKTTPNNISRLKQAYPMVKINQVAPDEFLVSGLEDAVVSQFGKLILEPSIKASEQPADAEPENKPESKPKGDVVSRTSAFVESLLQAAESTAQEELQKKVDSLTSAFQEKIQRVTDEMTVKLEGKAQEILLRITQQSSSLEKRVLDLQQLVNSNIEIVKKDIAVLDKAIKDLDSDYALYMTKLKTLHLAVTNAINSLALALKDFQIQQINLK